MVFVSAVEAKPMVPHKDGGSCLSCKATMASQWRGPGSNYCSLSQCKKAASAARQQTMRNTCAPLEETVVALQAEVHDLEEQLGCLDRMYSISYSITRCLDKVSRLVQSL